MVPFYTHSSISFRSYDLIQSGIWQEMTNVGPIIFPNYHNQRCLKSTRDEVFEHLESPDQLTFTEIKQFMLAYFEVSIIALIAFVSELLYCTIVSTIAAAILQPTIRNFFFETQYN